MSFLDDLPGIRDLQWEDEQLQPRRSVLRFIGAVTVADNAALGSTDITFDVPTVVGSLESFTADQPSYVQFGVDWAEAPHATLMRLSLASNVTVYGLLATLLPRLILVNLSNNYTLTLEHESAQPGVDPSDRILCPGLVSYVLGLGNSVELVRDTVSQRWRVVL